MAGNLKWKMSCYTVHSPPLRESPDIWWITFGLRGSVPHWVMLHWPAYQVTRKTTSFDGPPEREWSAVGTGRNVKQSGLRPWKSSGVQSPLANENTEYTLWQASVRESQHRALWLWSEAKLFVAMAILFLPSPAPWSGGASWALVAVTLCQIPSIIEKAAICPYWKRRSSFKIWTVSVYAKPKIFTKKF